ncbi:MAG: hypothetical protein ACLFP6_09885 [Spirochaetaceae bacterium]
MSRLSILRRYGRRVADDNRFPGPIVSSLDAGGAGVESEDHVCKDCHRHGHGEANQIEAQADVPGELGELHADEEHHRPWDDRRRGGPR